MSDLTINSATLFREAAPTLTKPNKLWKFLERYAPLVTTSLEDFAYFSKCLVQTESKTHCLKLTALTWSIFVGPHTVYRVLTAAPVETTDHFIRYGSIAVGSLATLATIGIFSYLIMKLDLPPMPVSKKELPESILDTGRPRPILKFQPDTIPTP